MSLKRAEGHRQRANAVGLRWFTNKTASIRQPPLDRGDDERGENNEQVARDILRQMQIGLPAGMSALGQKRSFVTDQPDVRFALPAQPIDATQALNLSAGVSNAKVLRGRSLSWRATLFRCAWE